MQYGETAGLADLREVVAADEAFRVGRPVAASDVVVTSGSQQALDLLARAVVDPGDPVVVEELPSSERGERGFGSSSAG